MSRVKNQYFDILEDVEKTKYLQGLSYDTRLMVVERLHHHQTNLYHSIMSVINAGFKKNMNYQSYDIDREKQNYFNKFKFKHNLDESQRENIYELFEFCFQKYILKSNKSIKGEQDYDKEDRS